MTGTSHRGERRARLRAHGGLLPAASLAGGVAAILVWTMTVSDPYWRLFQAGDVPTPVFRPAGVADPAAVVARDRHPRLSSRAHRAAAAGPLAAAVTVPVIAAELARDPETFREGLTLPAAAIGAEGRGAPRAAATLALLAPEPPVPPAIAEAFRPPVLRGDPLAAFAPPTSPAPPRPVADAAAELALALDRARRADIQRRLRLGGFDPGESDGVFGPGTRSATAEFQAAAGYPATGHLDGATLAELERRSDAVLAALAPHRQSRSRAPATAPVAPARHLADAEGGCRRDDRGRIVERQGFLCDLKGLTESILSLGRSRLDAGEGAGPSLVSAAMEGTARRHPGADR